MKATLPVSLLVAGACCGEAPIRATVDFGQQVRAWDGFGVNYVETAQTRDYAADPQEYGGFSLLTEDRRQRILDLIFGPDGLKPGLLKMFLDPHHQGAVNTGTFDHTTTTRWIRYFAREGHKKTRARGGDLAIITTLYGPPGWMTKQRFLRGRDLDPALKRDCARYLIEWVKYLGQVEGLPVKYISLHNEGEDYVRWPEDGSGPGDARHDYNLWWPPEQVVDFLRFMRPMLDQEGLIDVGLTPGETSNWYRFSEWGYASAIAADPVALKNLGLIPFARVKTMHPDAFVALNLAKTAKPLAIRVLGAPAASFTAFRTGPAERYVALGDQALQGGTVSYTAPAGSVTTFYGKL